VRKRLMLAVLITFLSFAPAYAGHSVAGYGYCTCDNPQSHTLGLRVQDDESTQDTHNDSAPEIELGLVLLAVLMFLKARA
jgi:hypothetical protein